MDSEGKPTDAAGTSTQPPGRRTDELLSLLAERIGAKLSSATVFGTPVERDGVTVVPVAAARFGFGAGGGSDPAKQQEGEGGGGGGGVVPVGYIELKDGRSRFIPVVHPARMLALASCAILAALAILRPAIPTTKRRSALRRR
ncbi:MAG TPA: spore germination protein GerW family protein [Solirubrobacteraceae bacterium]|nr:spore germination protein GerW family protein [Solirubrobacteraceae bacterium]